MAISRAQLQAHLFQVLQNQRLNRSAITPNPEGLPGVPAMGAPIDPGILGAVDNAQAVNAQPFGGPITDATSAIATGAPQPDAISTMMRNLAIQHLQRPMPGPPGTLPLTPPQRPPFIRPGAPFIPRPVDPGMAHPVTPTPINYDRRL